MALRDYYSGWDFERYGTSAMTVTVTSPGAHADAVTYLAGTYAHINLQSVMGLNSYQSIAASIQTYLNGLGGTRPTYTVSFSTTTMRYTFSVSAGTVQLTFSGASGTLMRKILGFSATTSAAASVTSDVRPYFAISAASPGPSAYSDEYEISDGIEDSEADDGTPYAIARYSLPTYVDWEQRLEEKTAPATDVSGGVATPGAGVFIYSASTLQPWTWQHMIEHVRGAEPFVLYNTTGPVGIVCKMRKDTAAFKPSRAMSDYDTLWNIPFKTRLLGRL